MQPLPLQTGKARRGLLEARIDTNHVVRLKGGRKVQLTTVDLQRADLKGQKPTWHCTKCNETWATRAELIKAHVSDRELEAADETHVFFGIVEVPAKADKTDKDGAVIEQGWQAHTLLVSHSTTGDPRRFEHE